MNARIAKARSAIGRSGTAGLIPSPIDKRTRVLFTPSGDIATGSRW